MDKGRLCTPSRLAISSRVDELPASVIYLLPSTLAPVALHGGLWGWCIGYGKQSFYLFCLGMRSWGGGCCVGEVSIVDTGPLPQGVLRR